MVTVALIVTGEMEQRGLAQSLGRLFANVGFTVDRFDGFTSAKVVWPPPRARGLQSNIEKFATALLAAILPARGEPRPDFVFGIDDLELENREQPETVIQCFRSAVLAELENRQKNMNGPAFDKFKERVKKCCSFHLFAPMPEAYFFADQEALQTVGCTRPPIIEPGDVEQFRSVDPDYLVDPAPAASSWAIDLARRPFHPKRYLEFLLHPDPYHETENGVRALNILNWHGVLGTRQHTKFLRSFLQDLAFALEADMAIFSGDSHPATSNYKDRNRVLRNL